MYYLEYVPERINRQYVGEAVEFAMNYLSLAESVNISIEWSESVISQDGFIYAETYDEDEQWYTIEINSELDNDRLLRAIFHQIVHVKQRELQVAEGNLYWKVSCSGKRSDAYEDQAYDHETIILKAFQKTKTKPREKVLG